VDLTTASVHKDKIEQCATLTEVTFVRNGSVKKMNEEHSPFKA
jgi:hypothetical protein